MKPHGDVSLWERSRRRPGEPLRDLSDAIAQALGQSPFEAELHRSVQNAGRLTGVVGCRPEDEDYGYCGINAAFVLDLLASLDSKELEDGLADSDSAPRQREEAKKIRRELIDRLTQLEKKTAWLKSAWWFHATLAEAHFGVGEYDQAKQWIERGKAIEGVKRWELESTIRQLASLARAQQDGALEPGSPAQKALLHIVGPNAPGVETAHWGKVGLALSGGGFRASLYHLGVLAALAEHDVLRHVEVLSSVSGGSIVGAQYYLAVQKLLEEKADGEVGSQDYVEVVEQVIESFCRGITKNIRTRVVANLPLNIAMIFSSRFSRTQRVGSLYEKLLYRGKKKTLPLRDLLVRPKGDGTSETFHPKYDNWRRSSKVPILVLNATTLNTGHNWQFTASWMGEPPATIDPDVDSVSRLRRLHHEEAPERHQNVRLGHAVAASACVPGLFEPLELAGLYEGGHNVRLVDGGVHDNQGIAGLLEQDCQVLLVSDASGQMDTETDPSRGPLGVPMRSNSILMARVRAAQLADLRARRQSERVRGLLYVHLKQGLAAAPINWIGCPPEKRKDPAALLPDAGSPDEFEMDLEIQQSLSKLRTDLDSFNEVECQALMLSGYLMTKKKLRAGVAELRREPVAERNWEFLRVKPLVKKDAVHRDVARLLDIGEKRAFKVWHFIPALKWSGLGVCLAAAGGALWFLFTRGEQPLLTLGGVASLLVSILAATAVGFVAGKVFGRWSGYIKGLLKPRNVLSRALLGIALAAIGWLVALVHLLTFDRFFLSQGRVDHWLGRDAAGRTGGGPARGARSRSDMSSRPSLNPKSPSPKDSPRS